MRDPAYAVHKCVIYYVSLHLLIQQNVESLKHQESEAPFDWKKEKQYLCQSHGGKKIPSQLLKKVRQLANFTRAVKQLVELIASLK